MSSNDRDDRGALRISKGVARSQSLSVGAAQSGGGSALLNQGQAMTTKIRIVLSLAVLIPGTACRSAETSSPVAASAVSAPSPGTASTPVATASVGERYVTLAFWNDSTCSGEPVAQRRMPVHYGDSQCFSWPGRSGTNSASRFSCGIDSFSYTQWTTLTCSDGMRPEGTRKTSYTTGCTQDFPPTLYSRVIDFSGCREAGN